jgi:hypothetical protein
MATTIVTKYGSDAPAASDLVRGELAVDTENGRLYTENAAGAVVEIGLNPEGNVGIGTSSPNAPLEVAGAATTSTDIAHFSNSNGVQKVVIGLDGEGDGQITLIDAGNNTDVLFTAGGASYINTGGNFGIGTSSPSTLLHLSAANDPIITLTDTDFGASADITGSNGNLRLNSQTATIFDMADSEIARFDSSGNLLVGKTSTTFSAVGVENRADGRITSTRSGNTNLLLNRLSSDGDIVQFYKDGTQVGSIGVASSRLYIGTDDTGLRFTNDEITPFNPNASADRNGTVDLGGSSTRFKDLYLSGGAYLGGTAAANKLDDYEEGTWTPDIVGDSTAGSYSSITRSGTYTKVGRLVTASFYFYGTSGTGSGKLNVTGFPFSAQGAAGLSVLQYNSGPVLPSGTGVPVLFLTSSSTTAEIRCNNDTSGGYVEMDYPTTANYVRASVTYETS